MNRAIVEALIVVMSLQSCLFLLVMTHLHFLVCLIRTIRTGFELAVLGENRNRYR